MSSENRVESHGVAWEESYGYVQAVQRDDVVDEVLYVVDADAGDAAAGPVRKEAYGRPDPQVASTMIGTPRLAFPELLVEIKMVARI